MEPFALKGSAVGFSSASLGDMWLVADEQDAAALQEPRGIIYTVDEINKLLILPAESRLEICQWKKTLNAPLNNRFPGLKWKKWRPPYATTENS